MGNSVTVTVTVYKMYTVTFVANAQVLATRQVGHGHDLGAEFFPEIPAREGYDQIPPVWNPTSLTNVTADTTVVAVYTINRYTVSAPKSQIGYQVKLSDEIVFHGGSVTFTVEVAEGYSSENMVVSVNGVVIEPVDGKYTFESVRSDLEIAVTGVADVTAPDAEIKIGTNAWHEFLRVITFGLAFNETQEIVVTASDAGSGIKEVFYLLSETALNMEQLQVSQWVRYTEPVPLNAEGNWVVYAKAVDNAGNVTYIGSDGLVFDTTAPQITGIENGGTYYGEVTFTVTDDHIATITVNGETVYDAASGEPVTQKRITLKPANGKQEIVITDKAGNTTKYTVTVHEKDADVSSPTTGDDSHLMLWVTMMVISLATIVVLARSDRKKYE